MSTLRSTTLFLTAMFAAAASQAGAQGAHAHHAAAQPTSLMAMLMPPSGAKAPAGMAMVTGTTVQITLTGDTPGAVRAWHIHKGSCGHDGGIVGDAAVFPTLTIGTDGKGTARATLGAPLPAGASYFINVHASPRDHRTIVACGALAAGGMQM